MEVKNLAVMAIASAFFMSCSKDNSNFDVSNQLTITTGVSTRASGTTWFKGDKIGVSVIKDRNFLYNNISFVNTNIDGPVAIFSSSTSVFYPESGSVDVLAYYPYNEDVIDNIYSLDVTNQSDLTKIDLMSAKRKNVTAGINALDMVFSHKLSCLDIKLAASEGMTEAELEGTSVAVSGLTTTGTYFLEGDLIMRDEPTSDLVNLNVDGTNVQGIIIPDNDLNLTLTFTLPSGVVKTAQLSNVDFVSGERYSYVANFTKTSLSIVSNSITDWEAGNEETTLF